MICHFVFLMIIDIYQLIQDDQNHVPDLHVFAHGKCLKDQILF